MLIEDVKAVVCEKLEFEKRDNSILIVFFENSGKAGTRRMDQNEKFSI